MTRRQNRFVRTAAKSKSKARDGLGFALIALAFTALAGMAAAGFMLRPPPTDAQTLCRTDRALTAHTFILVDATDRLEPRHRRKLQAVVAQERQRLAPFERLSIAALRPDRPQDPRVLFSLCLPRDGTQTNPLFENPRMAQERWEERIGKALKSAVRRAGAGRGANASPIHAGLRAIAADPDFGPEIPKRRLVLVSDLLEHEPGRFSLYAEDADYVAFRASPAGAAGPADLDDVDLRVVTLDRPDEAARQAAARDNFWRPYLDAAGAAQVDFDAAP